jgi:HlyD family secretion protein
MKQINPTTPSVLEETNKKNSPRKKRMLIVLIALLLIGAGGLAYYQLAYLPAQQSAAAAPQTQTATIRRGDLTLYASGTGTLVAHSEAAFGFNTSGQVTKVNVKVGDVVEADQVLAELESSSATLAYEQAKRAIDELTSPIAVATAQEVVATANDTLATTRASLEYLISPAVLKWEEKLANAQKALDAAKAAASASPSAENDQKVKDAEAAAALAQASLEVAQRDYPAYVKATFTESVTDPRTGEVKIVYYKDENGNRYTNIYTPSETDIASARAAYDLAKATLEEAQIYLTAISSGEIPDRATGSALANFETASENLVSAQDELDNTKLTAPILGTIMSLDFQVGDYVSNGASAATISDLTQPTLDVYFDESDWNSIKVGNKAEATFDILSSRTFSGQVTQVNPGLTTQGNTSAVRATIQLDAVDETFNLPLGTSVSVDVIGGQATNAILVPIEALHQSDGKYFVYVLVNGQSVERAVEIGLQDTLYAEVLSGLEADEVVVTGTTEAQ